MHLKQKKRLQNNSTYEQHPYCRMATSGLYISLNSVIRGIWDESGTEKGYEWQSEIEICHNFHSEWAKAEPSLYQIIPISCRSPLQQLLLLTLYIFLNFFDKLVFLTGKVQKFLFLKRVSSGPCTCM